MVNERMIRSGATGLGASAGNASAGLVRIFVNPPTVQLAFVVLALQAQISNCRRALKRFCPGDSIALTCTRRTVRTLPSFTVTCLPATGALVDSHCVASGS